MGAYTLLIGLNTGTTFLSKRPSGNSNVLLDNQTHTQEISQDKARLMNKNLTVTLFTETQT